MKKVLLFVFLFSASMQMLRAQCSACTPTNCSAQKPTGGLCNSLPDDTAGQPYDAVISFYMPKQLTDPTTLGQCGGCSSVTLRQIDIVGIQGLPPGLSYYKSQNGSYNVQGGDSLGCVHFCGTPVAPGTYYVTVNLLADVTANGVPVLGSVDANDQAQSYRDTLVIYPGVSACPGTFDLGNGCITHACDSVGVNLNATLTNTHCANLISYSWDLGNGQTSSVKTPGAVNYTTPDTFHLTLNTTYYTYRIKQVTVNVSGGYTGDIEELTGAQNADIYIRVNSLAFNNRGCGSAHPCDANSVTFSNLNLTIPPDNCADQIEIQVWDEDTGPPQGTNPFGSQDDNINNHVITPSMPNQVTSILNNSTIAVTFDTVAVSTTPENVDIIVFPHPPVPVLTVANDSLCSGDSTLITLTPVLPGYLYNWYLNDTTELLTNDTAIYTKVAGSYTAKITNLETGCTEHSAPVSVAVGAASPAVVNILYNGTQLFVSPFPASGFSVEWFYNGNLIPNQTGKFLPYYGNGIYTANLYNTNFPNCRTAANPDTLNISGIEQIAYDPIYDLSIYPNPNNGNFTLKFISESTEDITITVSDLIGQTVYQKKLEGFSGNFNQDLNLSEMPKGVYLVNIETAHSRTNKKVVVQ
ncbi:MAG: T9SS type A sorting domain-containing protein [Chitinophagales bacterium]